MRQCHVPECGRQIRSDLAMCRPHWFRVPAALRAEVWRLFRKAPGSAEHLRALDAAVDAVH